MRMAAVLFGSRSGARRHTLLEGLKMKLSKLIHLISILVGIAGAGCLFGAWIAGDNGRFSGFSQAHLFNDAIALELIAIAASICTLVRIELEKANPGSSPIL